MSHSHLSPEVVEAAQTVGTALAPATAGAAIAQLFRHGLTFGERLVQIVVGITVSWFVGRLVEGVYAPNAAVTDAIKFVVGMIAYEATPKFIHNTAEAVASLPATIRDRFASRKDTGQ
jgi:hypothetical protein